MKPRSFLPIVLCACVPAMIFQCGKGTQGKIERVRLSVDSLKAAGAPDSMLSEIEVLRFDAESQAKHGSSRIAKQKLEESVALLEDTRKRFVVLREEAIASVDSFRGAVRMEKGKLTSVRAEVLQKAAAEMDSIFDAGQVLEAHAKGVEIVAMLPHLLECEEQARQNTPLVSGRWARKATEKEKDAGSDFVETEEYNFQKDGGFVINETKKGFHNKNVYMDYQYVSRGQYILDCDTVKMFVKRIKGYSRNRLRVAPDANEWKPVNTAPFDSAVTNGSQDRSKTLTEFRQHFKR